MTGLSISSCHISNSLTPIKRRRRDTRSPLPPSATSSNLAGISIVPGLASATLPAVLCKNVRASKMMSAIKMKIKRKITMKRRRKRWLLYWTSTHL